MLCATNAFADDAAAAFAGGWVWDRAQSKDLPPKFAETTSWQLTVTATEKQLEVEVAMESGQSERPTQLQTLRYPFHRTESSTKNSIAGRQGPQEIATRLAGKVLGDGSLELTMERDILTGEATRSLMQREHWRLSADKATLTIFVHTEALSGPLEYQLAFKRR